MGSQVGADKSAAVRLGMTFDEYVARRKDSQKYCYKCKEWKRNGAFAIDNSRGDGRSSLCKNCRNFTMRSRYRPKPKRILKGRSFVPARSGDKLQARRRINYFVEAKIIAAPNDLPCVDCGHPHGNNRRRHEYDHYLGYESQFHESVEAVCSRCHHERELMRSREE